MTGFDNQQLAEMEAAGYRPDDDFDTRTDEECPYCGHELEHDGTAIFCDRCEVVWHSGDELARDRRDVELLEEHQSRQP